MSCLFRQSWIALLLVLIPRVWSLRGLLIRLWRFAWDLVMPIVELNVRLLSMVVFFACVWIAVLRLSHVALASFVLASRCILRTWTVPWSAFLLPSHRLFGGCIVSSFLVGFPFFLLLLFLLDCELLFWVGIGHLVVSDYTCVIDKCRHFWTNDYCVDLCRLCQMYFVDRANWNQALGSHSDK